VSLCDQRNISSVSWRASCEVLRTAITVQMSVLVLRLTFAVVLLVLMLAPAGLSTRNSVHDFLNIFV